MTAPKPNGRLTHDLAGSDGSGHTVSLAELCRSVAGVAGLTAVPPRRIRVTAGDLSIEAEWPEPTPGPAGPHTAPARPPEGPADGTVPDASQVVTSPLVGTFYRSPSPGAEPFVCPGDRVEAGQQVGIVEAMKLMNAVDAPCAGRVLAVHATDGESVEYGQALLTLDTADEEPMTERSDSGER